MKLFDHVIPRSINFNLREDIFSISLQTGEATLSTNFLNERSFLNDGDAYKHVKGILLEVLGNHIEKGSIRVECYTKDNVSKVSIIGFTIDDNDLIMNAFFEGALVYADTILRKIIKREIEDIKFEKQYTILEKGVTPKGYSYTLYENKSDSTNEKYIMDLRKRDVANLHQSYHPDRRFSASSIAAIFGKLKVKEFL